MKKRLRLLAWMLTLTMLCEVLPFGAFAQSDVGQQLALAAAQSLEEENGEATIIGKCGDNLQWSLSSDGVLTIDGTGEMDDYRPLNYPLAPWNAHMSMAKQDNYKKERTETALSFHFSDFGMRGYISMVKPSGLFLRFSFSFW